MAIHFSTLEEVTISQIVDVFNASFANYFVPIQFTATSLRAKMKQEGTQLSLSVGAFDGEQLVGIILQGVREQDGKREVYNGGTGVLPSYRGQQITEKMYQFILPKLREGNIHKALLEVITENIPAIKVYERVGFQKVRKLICWKKTNNIPSTNLSIAVSFRPITILDWTEISTLGSITPTWQNSNFALNNILSTNYILGGYCDSSDLIAYIMVNLSTGRISQLGVHPQWRRKGIGTALIQQIAKNCHSNLSIINVPEDASAILYFLKTMGFINTINQFEMSLNIS